MPRTTAPSTNPRILSGYAPYSSTNSVAAPKAASGPASTSEGRRQLLVEDPFARDVQPEQVTCTRCSKTVRLQKGKQYHLAHWLDHRWRCDRMESEAHPKTRCRTLSERKAYLEADPDAKIVESERVVCGRCNKEVKLRKGRAYGLSCWTQHKVGCHSPSHSPVASAYSSRSSSPLPTEILRHHFYKPTLSSYDHDRIFPKAMQSNPALSRSASPPALSFSTASSSASTSLASSPMASPQLRRTGSSLFSHSRHLPFPELPSVVGLSRLSITKECDADEPNKSALGLQFSPSRGVGEGNGDEDTGLIRLPPPLPYLEHTPMSLPVPQGYWRFGP